MRGTLSNGIGKHSGFQLGVDFNSPRNHLSLGLYIKQEGTLKIIPNRYLVYIKYREGRLGGSLRATASREGLGTWRIRGLSKGS